MNTRQRKPQTPKKTAPRADAKRKDQRTGKGKDTAATRNSAALDARALADAMDRTQAMVELGLDGTILRINENFTRALGYRAEEIVGRHHSVLVDAAYRESEDYRTFWSRLRDGEFITGDYHRIDKQGRTVWLRGIYNPVLDARGRPLKILKIAVDVTAQHTFERSSSAYKGSVDSVSTSVMMADEEFRIVYVNGAAKEMFQRAQADFRKVLPAFDANRLIGESMDVFHRNPAHQRSLLAALSKTYSSELDIGGRSLRITANPVHDTTGKRIGTVVEWLDRTQEVAIEREVADMVSAILEGHLDTRIEVAGKSGFFESLSKGINQLAGNLGEIVARVKAASAEVSSRADEMNQGSANLSQRTEEQASSLEETASSMEQMTSTVKQNADNSAQANQLAVAARDQAERGGAVVVKAVRAMADINESSKKIADIIGVIDEIAFQTNLLALNAAVEAARAGEQGRGFAVVASEVRNLAGRSATAAKEIKDLIQDSVKKVDEGSSLVTQSGVTLEQIVSAVKKVSDIIAEIAAASQEQSSGIEQVNKAVMQLDELTQQNAALVEEASAASQAMAEQSRALLQMMDRYELDAAQIAEATTGIRATDPGRTATQAPSAPAMERRGSGRPWSSRKPAAAPAAAPSPRPAAARATGTNGAEWEEF